MKWLVLYHEQAVKQGKQIWLELMSSKGLQNLIVDTHIQLSCNFVFFFCREQVALYCMFVAIMAFHARISDPRVGGTYLTLLNTLTNLGGNWCQTLALWLVDGLTWTNCIGATIPGLHCSSKTSAKVQAIILKLFSFCIVFFV